LLKLRAKTRKAEIGFEWQQNREREQTGRGRCRVQSRIIRFQIPPAMSKRFRLATIITSP